MHIEGLRDYCIKKPGVTEELPFDDVTLVFKVMGKVFLITSLETFTSFNVKCDPEKAIELREQYDGVLPGYHMNKKHWNTILMDGSIPDKQALQWIDDSYQLVASKLTKAQKEALQKL